MSRFRLTYCKPSGRLVGVVILDSWLDSWDIIQAGMRAAVMGIDQGGEFCEGHERDEATAALVPADAIGRLLSRDEAAWLIRRARDPETARCPVRRPAKRKRAWSCDLATPYDDRPVKRRERHRGPSVTLGHIPLAWVHHLLICRSGGPATRARSSTPIAGQTRPCSWIWTGGRSAPSAV